MHSHLNRTPSEIPKPKTEAPHPRLPPSHRNSASTEIPKPPTRAPRHAERDMGGTCKAGPRSVVSRRQGVCTWEPSSLAIRHLGIQRSHLAPSFAYESPTMKLHALLIALLVATVAADSVTDELEKNGLPVGLLPTSVKSYSISKDGQFTLSLDGPCYAKIDDQLAYYSQNITGKLKYGAISNLDGIETKQLFVWLPVTGIYVDVPATPYIYFEVGVLTKRLALAVFETPIKCNAHHSETFPGFHIPSWVANGAVGGSRPRKALQ